MIIQLVVRISLQSLEIKWREMDPQFRVREVDICQKEIEGMTSINEIREMSRPHL